MLDDDDGEEEEEEEDPQRMFWTCIEFTIELSYENRLEK